MAKIEAEYPDTVSIAHQQEREETIILTNDERGETALTKAARRMGIDWIAE